MRQELYAALRERIVKVVPEIMELKFGCKIRFGENYVYSGNVHVDWHYSTILRRHHNWCYEIYEIIADNRPHNDLEITKIFRKDWLKTDKHFEILGRDIQLADCLMAIGTGRKEFMSASTQGNGVAFVVKVGEGHMVWNLALPLHEQSDELGEWLLTILTPSA